MEERNSYNIQVVASLKEKRQLGGPRHVWEDNFKIILSKVREHGLDSYGSRYGRVCGCGGH